MPNIQDFFTIHSAAFAPYTPAQRVQILYAAKARLMEQIRLAERTVSAVTPEEQTALWGEYVALAAANPEVAITPEESEE